MIANIHLSRVRRIEVVPVQSANGHIWRDFKITDEDGYVSHVSAFANDAGKLELRDADHPATCFCVDCLGGHPPTGDDDDPEDDAEEHDGDTAQPVGIGAIA